jgi:hypothetical protein
MDGELAASPTDRLAYVGPIEHHAVVVNGHLVPFLSATPMNGGRIDLTLDQRIALELSVQDAERVLPFIADCIAVALGYAAHPGESGAVARSPFPRMAAVTLD